MYLKNKKTKCEHLLLTAVTNRFESCLRDEHKAMNIFSLQVVRRCTYPP